MTTNATAGKTSDAAAVAPVAGTTALTSSTEGGTGGTTSTDAAATKTTAQADGSKAAQATAATETVDPKLAEAKAAEAKAAVAQAATTKAAEDKAAADALAAKTAAEFKLTVPEGFQADEALLGKFKTTAQELGLKGEHAQKILDVYVDAQKTLNAQAAEQLDKQREDWAKQAKADKEFGGEKYPASLQHAARAMERYGSPELRELLEVSGLGNHPALVRAFVKAGADLAEDTVAGHSGGTGATPHNDAKAFQKALYTHPSSQAALFKE